MKEIDRELKCFLAQRHRGEDIIGKQTGIERRQRIT